MAEMTRTAVCEATVAPLASLLKYIDVLFSYCYRSMLQRVKECYNDFYWPYDYNETILGLRYVATGILLLAAVISLLMTFVSSRSDVVKTELWFFPVPSFQWYSSYLITMQKIYQIFQTILHINFLDWSHVARPQRINCTREASFVAILRWKWGS